METSLAGLDVHFVEDEVLYDVGASLRESLEELVY